jgi:hypothetical protein
MFVKSSIRDIPHFICSIPCEIVSYSPHLVRKKPSLQRETMILVGAITILGGEIHF